MFWRVNLLKSKTNQDAHNRLLVRAILSVMLLAIFCVLLILIFYVELPSSMETLSSVLLGALVGNLTSCLGYWFDSTESADRITSTGNGH